MAYMIQMIIDYITYSYFSQEEAMWRMRISIQLKFKTSLCLILLCKIFSKPLIITYLKHLKNSHYITFAFI